MLRVFAKWGLDAVIVGTVEPEPRLRIRHHGELVADIPNQSLTDDAPLYHRPVGTWKAPVSLDPPEDALIELSKDRDYTGDLKKLLASANVCSKRWVHEQYDTMVQTNTVLGPGGEAGVMRIKGTGTKGHRNREQGSENRERGLAMALDGNGRWAYLDPKLGAMHAVAEAARKVACTGAMPVAATNCLNFGNPEKPEIMAQLSAAIDGIAEACTALGTPVTGGNVSLYNETRGEGIYPTPVLGIVGILDDVTKAVPAAFQRSGDAILLLWPVPRAEAPNPNLRVPFQPIPINPYIVPPMSLDPAFPVAEPLAAPVSDAEQDTVETPAEELAAFGSSEFAKAVLGELWGKPPDLDLEAEADLHTLLRGLADRKLLHSARDISDGGIAVAKLAAGCVRKRRRRERVEQEQSLMAHPLFGLFAEPSSTVILVCSGRRATSNAIEKLAGEYNFFVARIGTTGGDRLEISVDHQPLVWRLSPICANPGLHRLNPRLHDEGDGMSRLLFQGVANVADLTDALRANPAELEPIPDPCSLIPRAVDGDDKLREECGVVADSRPRRCGAPGLSWPLRIAASRAGIGGDRYRRRPASRQHQRHGAGLRNFHR